MPKIFICHRKSGGDAGFGSRIADRLVGFLDPNHFLRDIEDIGKATYTVENIAKATSLCDLLPGDDRS